MVESRGIWTSMKNFVVKPSDFSGAKFASLWTVVEISFNQSQACFSSSTTGNVMVQAWGIGISMKYLSVKFSHFVSTKSATLCAFVEVNLNRYQTFPS